MNVTGTWKGEYSFEEGEGGAGRQVAGKVVTFTMELKHGWLGAVTGTVQDDPRAGFPEQGVIKGKLKGQVLSFEKIMPVMRMIHESTRLTLEQWAERRKVVMDTKVGHPKIRHIGDFSADGNSVDGTFLMPEYDEPVPGSQERVMMPKLAGTWKMSRAT